MLQKDQANRMVAEQHITNNQGRNFGLKSGGTNSEGERDSLGPRGERGAQNGEEVFRLEIRLWGLGECREFFQWGPRQSLGRKGFIKSLQIASVDSM